MTVKELLQELESRGTEQTRKTYRRHGVKSELYGVSYADFGKLKKKIKIDGDLARGLWASGNYDARIFATMIADPKGMTEKEIDAWIKDIDFYAIGDALAGLVAQMPFARKKAEKWIQAKDELTAAAGWSLLARLTGDKTLPDSYFEGYLYHIEKTIHGAQNRVRYNMNNAVIAIGVRSEELMQKATAVARKIGKVEVDHGNTSCLTPDAETYIQKTMERKRRKTS